MKYHNEIWRLVQLCRFCFLSQQFTLLLIEKALKRRLRIYQKLTDFWVNSYREIFITTKVTWLCYAPAPTVFVTRSVKMCLQASIQPCDWNCLLIWLLSLCGTQMRLAIPPQSPPSMFPPCKMNTLVLAWAWLGRHVIIIFTLPSPTLPISFNNSNGPSWIHPHTIHSS